MGVPVSVAPPQGWAVSSTTLTGLPGDAKLVLERQKLDSEAAVDDLAAEHDHLLAGRIDGYVSQPLTTVASPTGRVLARRFQGETGSGGYQVYAAGAGVGAVATVTADELSDDDLHRIAQLLSTSVTPLAPTWARTYSVEELTALAELAGSKSFPGTGEYVLQNGQRASARRALLARGTLAKPTADGRTPIDAVDARLVTTGLYPDAVITVVVRRAGREEQLLVYAAPGLSVAHRASPDGVHRLEGVPTAWVGAVVSRFARVEDRPVPSAEPIKLGRETFRQVIARRDVSDGGAELAQLLESLVTSCHLRSVPGPAAQVASVDMTWFDCGDRGNWLVEAHGDEVTARPVSLLELSALFEKCSP